MRQDVADAEVVSWRPFALTAAGVVVASVVFVTWLAWVWAVGGCPPC
jgi:hypothetical protein